MWPASSNKAKKPIFIRRKSPPRWPSTLKTENDGRPGVKFFLFLFILGLWAYVLFFSPWFQVAAVEVSGGEPEVNQKLKDSVLKILTGRVKQIFPNRNVFIFGIPDANQISRQLGVADISFSKNFFDRAVYVTYQERQPVAVLSLPEGQFKIDRDGKNIAAIDAASITDDLPVIFADQSSVDAGLISPALVAAVSKISREAEALSLRIASYSVQDAPDIPIKPEEPPADAPNANTAAGKTQNTAAGYKKGKKEVTSLAGKEANANVPPADPPDLKKMKELVITTGLGWRIYLGSRIFDEADGLDQQLYNLEIFTKEKLQKINPKHLQYVDLRFGDKIYYK